MIWVFSWCPLLKSKFLRKMDVKISLAVSLALNQILTGEPDTSFPNELRSVLRWTSKHHAAGRHLDVKAGEITVCRSGNINELLNRRFRSLG